MWLSIAINIHFIGENIRANKEKTKVKKGFHM